jgi:hypothetical protein
MSVGYKLCSLWDAGLFLLLANLKNKIINSKLCFLISFFYWEVTGILLSLEP